MTHTASSISSKYMDKNVIQSKSSKFYERYKNIFREKIWMTTSLLNFWFYSYNESNLFLNMPHTFATFTHQSSN